MKIFKVSMTSIALVAVLWVGNVSANTVTLNDYPITGDVGVVCLTGCEGFTGTTSPAILSSTDADRYTVPGNSGDTTELAFLNDVLLGTSGAVSGVVKHEDTFINSFTVTREYFSIKQKSDNWWYFKNTSGGALEVTLAFIDSDGEFLREVSDDDWSHWTEYGNVVPIPAAVWLFGTAVIGLVGFKHRQTKIQESFNQ